MLFSFDAVLTVHVTKVFDWNSTGVGLIFLSIAVLSVAAPLAGHISQRTGARAMISGSFLVCTPCFVLLRFANQRGAARVVILCVLLSLTGLALAAVATAAFTEVVNAVEEFEKQHGLTKPSKMLYSQALCIMSMCMAASACVAPLWGGLIVDAAGWDTYGWSTAILSSLSSTLTLWGLRPSPRASDLG